MPVEGRSVGHVVATLFVAVVALCAGGSWQALAADKPIPLRPSFVGVPAFAVGGYATRGRLIQVRHSSLDLRRTNRALRQAIVDDQRAFEPYARRAAKVASKGHRGLYSVNVEPSFVSASSRVVSALLPSIHRPVGNQHGKDWIGVTVLVPSGRRLFIADVVETDRVTLRALARLIGSTQRRSDPEFWSFCGPEKYPSTYRPTVNGLSDVAFVPSGLAFGFAQPPACDRPVVVVPYRAAEPMLTALGRRLMRDVRAPR